MNFESKQDLQIQADSHALEVGLGRLLSACGRRLVTIRHPTG